MTQHDDGQGSLNGTEYQRLSDDIKAAILTGALAPGDRLVLYSDGVTEAFSPQGDMYGETRLVQVLENNADGPAQSVLDAILDSVHEFTHDAPLADDLTLLVLQRDASSHSPATHRRRRRRASTDP